PPAFFLPNRSEFSGSRCKSGTAPATVTGIDAQALMLLDKSTPPKGMGEGSSLGPPQPATGRQETVLAASVCTSGLRRATGVDVSHVPSLWVSLPCHPPGLMRG